MRGWWIETDRFESFVSASLMHEARDFTRFVATCQQLTFAAVGA
jgi:hypothetical protein